MLHATIVARYICQSQQKFHQFRIFCLPDSWKFIRNAWWSHINGTADCVRPSYQSKTTKFEEKWKMIPFIIILMQWHNKLNSVFPVILAFISHCIKLMELWITIWIHWKQLISVNSKINQNGNFPMVSCVWSRLRTISGTTNSYNIFLKFALSMLDVAMFNLFRPQ